MEREANNVDPPDTRAVLSHHENFSSLLKELGQHLGEALAALDIQSARLTSIERRLWSDEPSTKSDPQTEELWEGTVKRFTDSIDVRLDILEDELGALQEELQRLEKATRDATDVSQRRLVRGYAIGQTILGLLIVVLFLSIWPDHGKESALGPSSGSPEPAVTAPKPIPSATVSPPGELADEASSNVTHTDVGTDDAGPAQRNSETGEASGNAGREAAKVKPGARELVRPDGQSASAPGGVPESSAGGGLRGSSNPASPAEVSNRVDQPSSDADSKSEPSAAQDQASKSDDQTGRQPTDFGEERRALPAEAQPNGDVRAFEESAPQTGNAESNFEFPERAIVLNEERFSIQLIAFRNESSLAPFVESYGIADAAYYLRLGNGNQGWYCVLLGNYGTKEEGRAALEALPPRLRDLDPWLRSLPVGARIFPASKRPKSDAP